MEFLAQITSPSSGAWQSPPRTSLNNFSSSKSSKTRLQEPPKFGFGQDFNFQLSSIASGLSFQAEPVVVPLVSPTTLKKKPADDPELELLQSSFRTTTSLGPSLSKGLEHAHRNAPLLTGEVADRLVGQFPQRAVLGSIVSQHSTGFPTLTSNPKLYLNVNTPFSALICGVQGSGKSHSASVILEGCLLVEKRVGTLPKPLSALCLHYDGGSVNYPCESAYLGMPATRAQLGGKSTAAVPITVLVSPTCLATMKKIYKPLKVDVQPFYLSTSSLNSGRMLSLMGFDDSAIMPLYLQRAMTILRQMGADNFNYASFKALMAKEKLNSAQKCSFQMRIEMLDSFLTGKNHADVASYFKPGRLVIVDLRDPFTNSSLVIALFDIVVGLFVEKKMDTGKVLLLDEAHKYLNSDPNSIRFTDSIASLIRQQRHFGIRTIISTQEPTVVPDTILDLVSFLVLHRFSSPTWIHHLAKHISVDINHDQDQDHHQDRSPSQSQRDDLHSNQWSKLISRLPLGEALVVSPTALSLKSPISSHSVEPLATGFFIIRTRKRLTFDGGASIVACTS